MTRIGILLCCGWLLVTSGFAGDREEEWFQASLAAFCRRVAAAPASAPIPVPKELANRPSLEIPAASVLGLVLLGEEQTLSAGPYREVLKRLSNYVMAEENLAPKAIVSHETWVLSFALLFLCELDRVDSTAVLRDLLNVLAGRLAKGQDEEKGWHHSLAAGGYGPFSAATLWATTALYAAGDRGIAVDDTVLTNGTTALSRSLRPSGGASYFCYANRTVLSGGRAGGVIWALGRGKALTKEQQQRTGAFMLAHLKELPDGHGSRVMNLAQAALGVSWLDERTQRRFWEVHRQTIFSARREDGSFPPQTWSEIAYTDARVPTTINLGNRNTWPDRTFGDGWTTPWMLLAWQCRRGRCVLARNHEDSGGQ